MRIFDCNIPGLLLKCCVFVHVCEHVGERNSYVTLWLHTPTAPVDVIDPDSDPLVVPQPVVDPETGDDGISDTSATVMFTLPAEIEENGPVDR